MIYRKINQLEFKHLCLIRQNYHYLLFDLPFKSTIADDDNNCTVIVYDTLPIVCILGETTVLNNCTDILTALNIQWQEPIKITDSASMGILSALYITAKEDNTINFTCKNIIDTSFTIGALEHIDISIIGWETKIALANALHSVALNNHIAIDFNLNHAIDEAFSVVAKLVLFTDKVVLEHEYINITNVECYNQIFRLLWAAAIEYINSINIEGRDNIDVNMNLNLLLGKLASLADWENNSLEELNDFSLEDLKVYIQGE